MSKTVDLGPVSAYALAVKYGYTGTEEEWVAEMESKRKEAVEAAGSAVDSEASAANYAAASASSASTASNKADAASNSATRAESYAVGGTGIRQNEDVDNAKYYYQQIKQISGGMSGALIPLGTVAFADLQNQTKQVGYMYNISDDFTTDDTFKDGSGYTYPAGTNVYYTADGYWDCLAGTITPEGIGALAIDGNSAENTVTFETADAAEANAWTDVDVLVSGEKHSSIFNKVSTMFKNVRYLYKMLGTTDISAIGGGTVTGAIASQNEALKTVNANLRKQYIQCGGVTCTYYTPYFLRAIVTLPVAYSRAIAGFASKATNVSDASSHVSCLLEGNNKISIFVENKDGIFTASDKQSVYWMTVGVK